MPTEILGTKLFTIKEAGELFNVTEATIRKYVKDGELKSTRIGGRFFISEENIRKYVLQDE